jgi:hypothetical protein
MQVESFQTKLYLTTSTTTGQSANDLDQTGGIIYMTDYTLAAQNDGGNVVLGAANLMVHPLYRSYTSNQIELG